MNLKDLRTNLLKISEIREFVHQSRKSATFLDFAICLGFLFSGFAISIYATLNQSIWIFAGVAAEIMGLVGFLSLEHEGWHGRAIPNQRKYIFLVRNFIAPLLL